MAKWLEHIPGLCESLSSIHITKKKKNQAYKKALKEYVLLCSIRMFLKHIYLLIYLYE